MEEYTRIGFVDYYTALRELEDYEKIYPSDQYYVKLQKGGNGELTYIIVYKK